MIASLPCYVVQHLLSFIHCTENREKELSNAVNEKTIVVKICALCDHNEKATLFVSLSM